MLTTTRDRLIAALDRLSETDLQQVEEYVGSLERRAGRGRATVPGPDATARERMLTALRSLDTSAVVDEADERQPQGRIFSP